MIGKLLGGRYQVIEILAIGGFGQTYIAIDSHRPGNPECVVKHLKPANVNSGYLQNARRLFRSEAETLEKLGHHDQIPRLLAYFEENQEFYLVQDFIQGHPLSNELQLGTRWNESKVVQLLQEVLLILEFVHSYGVIHRDIKPNNIIQRQQDGKYVLVDFGSVKQVWTQVVTDQGETNSSFAIGMPVTIGIGTPGYMPTEQVRGRPRPNSDIYALGIICIQALTGVHPTHFQEDTNTGEILWQHQAQVSDGLAAILSKMVRYHFKERYQTTVEVLQALQPLVNSTSARSLSQNGEDLRSHPLNVPQPTVAFSKPNSASAPNPTKRSLLSEFYSKPQTVVHSKQSAQEQISGQQIVSETVANPLDITVNSQATPPATRLEPNSSQLPTVSSLTAHQPTIRLPPEPQASSSSQNVTVVTDLEATQANTTAKYTAIPATHNQRHLRIGAAITAVCISLVAGYTIYSQPRPNVREALGQIESLKAEGNSQACINQAAKISQDSPLYSDAQALLHECRLAQAKQLAGDRAFEAALTEASKIPQNSASYQDAQQLINHTSNSILEVATSEYQSGKLNSAINQAKAIPKTSPVYQKAQQAIEQWNKDWAKNNSQVQAAKTALEQGKWQTAINSAQQVVNAPYWQKQVEPIIQQAKSEIAADKTASDSKPTKPAASVTKPSTPTTVRRQTTSPTRATTPTTQRRQTTPVTKPSTPTTVRRQTTSPTRATTPTTQRRQTTPVTKPSTPTTTRRIKRSATNSPTRNTPKRQSSVNKPPKRNNSKPKARGAAPPKRSYKWTTKTIP